MFPPEYHNQIFIAEHGSWNRSKKIGYRISLVRLLGDKAVAYELFASGWLQGERAWGRPADVLVLPDGSLLVADDQADAIYRITYRPPRRETLTPSAGSVILADGSSFTRNPDRKRH